MILSIDLMHFITRCEHTHLCSHTINPQLLLITRPVFIPDMYSYKGSNPVTTPHKNACNPNEYPDLTLSSINVNNLKLRAINKFQTI